ncbi:ABC transporter permease [Micromonospora eburnea]|uniref:Putative ABC transport system permease protein n=1 Tax=Micromonospora eburnea TaxID=227316 RepID=A0A1C6UXL0_9ACTN|nr:FtsX-like permease family protein [Micromonospora eburnea]SCL58686.1 putative ABC transport system permease protein [Micromonospora eburnea]
MAGRLLLVCRLMVRDLRRRRTETALLLIAVTAATATLTLGLALDNALAKPYERTRAATAGPDVVAMPGATGPEALAALAPLATAPGVTAYSGPYPIGYLMLTAQGKTVQAVVQGRDDSPAALDRPAVTAGTWVRPGGAVIEPTFANALGVRIGDTVDINGHPLRVVGTAVTAARAVYPGADWRADAGSPLTENAGLVWVDSSQIGALAGARPLSYALNLRYADPRASTSFDHMSMDGIEYTSWVGIAEADSRLVRQARVALLVGSWLLTALAVASVANIVAGRVADQRRRVGLLKAVGAGPAMIAAVHLAEYLVIGLAAAGTGLVAGWLAAPALTNPGAGLLGATGAQPPALRTVLAATALALAIAAAAALAPVLRAATTDTVQALADAATPPRRRGWRVWLSRRMPTALLIGIRINARRPRRARLVMVNTLITTAALAALLMGLAQNRQVKLGESALANPRDTRTLQAMLLVVVVLCVLALINAVVSTWAAVLDARHPLAVARALGATPAQVTAGMAVAQLLPAIPGVALGIPAGIGLFLTVSLGEIRYPPGSWLLATALGTLLAIAALTALPALAAARRPVADSLRSVPA